MIEKRLNYSHLLKSVKDSSSAIYLPKTLECIGISILAVNLRTDFRIKNPIYVSEVYAGDSVSYC